MPDVGPDHITVLGAEEHNLKGVDVTLPRDALIVITGLSGSGKSSLAFDTIYQEGQRRFMESLSAYARQFLGKMEKPRVDHVDGLSPTLSIDQKTVNRNPRSTVGTVTEILDHLRLLMARLGTPRCPHCRRRITALSPGQITEALLGMRSGARLVVMAPIVRDRKGEYRKELEDLRSDGWLRVRIDGEIVRIDEQEVTLARYERHTLEVVLDRVRANPESRDRVREAVERGLQMTGGTVTALVDDGDGGWDHRTLSSARACPDHPDVAVPELEPRLFSFNAPQGACPTCKGLGLHEGFDVERLLEPDRPALDAFLPLGADGRIAFSTLDRDAIRQAGDHLGADLSQPWKDQPEPVQRFLLLGEGPPLDYHFTKERDNGRVDVGQRPWRGLLKTLEMVWHYTHHTPLAKWRVRRPCEACGGARLNAIARAVDFRGKGLGELSAMTVDQSLAFFGGVKLRGNQARIGRELVKEIQDRLGFLHDVGLGYLGLDRSATTLAGGEAQRIRLAAQVGSGLQGVTYVLDEPSIGLHPRDNRRLLDTLLALRDRGNTVMVVEHDEETMVAADHLVDIGPGAGIEGGEIVAAGTPKQVRRGKSLTARYLRGEEGIPLPEQRRTDPGEVLGIRGATAHNLRDVDVDIPLGRFVVLTGVSGSGKSTLMMEVLQRAVSRHLRPHGKDQAPLCLERLDGVERVDKLVVIDQSPIGRTPRSNPATYTKAFDDIRALFARLPESRARGYKPGRFSFNVAGGRCEECSGAGVKTVEMQFLADVEVTCTTCQGRRFNDETLEIRYRGHTITDVLGMSIAEAADFFRNHRRLARTLDTLVTVGMGYVKLGQPSTTLSGGEAQRIKLSSELKRPATGHTLYLLDEPTTGLHAHDVKSLLGALGRLVDGGNTVLVIEHNSDVIKVADHLIDLGPEGGDGGGLIVGEGTPEQLATLDTPTGQVLAAMLEFGGPGHTLQRRRRRRRARETDLVVEGATCHNLKGIDVRIPQGSLTVITGVSGSGKTSLAFDTLFAEGQRRYVECLSTYARRFLGRLDRAPVERVEGLAPAIAIQQKAASRSPRSTVATTTEIQDYLRLLWARIGEPHCPHCGREVVGWSPSGGARYLVGLAPGRGWLITQLRPESHTVEELGREGFVRLLDRGGPAPTEVLLEDPEAEGLLARGAELVVDRVRPGATSTQRLSEGLQTAYAWGDGSAAFVPAGGPAIALTLLPACIEHGRVLPEAFTPRHFSFNSHAGACPACDGLGRLTALDPTRVIPERSKPLAAAMDGRVASVVNRSARIQGRLAGLFAHLGLDPQSPVQSWSEAQLEAVWRGLPGVELQVRWSKSWGRTTRNVQETVVWEGLVSVLEGWQGSLDWLRREQTCPACHGGRLRPESLAVTLGGQDIHTHQTLSVLEMLAFWEGLELPEAEARIADQARREVVSRLRFLRDVGLGYLHLDRPSASLSGGEAQRIRLASQLGSGLTGCIYVLDEPTIGLHPRDTARLLGTLTGLRDLGNTVVVVEHDEDTIWAADQVFDLGPGAGEQGGQVIAHGTPQQIAADPASLTGAYLSGRLAIPARAERRSPRGWIRLRGVTLHNLDGLDVGVPTGVLTVVTGVSGSGKSTLFMDVLVPALRHELKPESAPPACESVAVADPEGLRRLVVVNQRPIGRTPRSTPATYTKVMDPLRQLFASTRMARERGWKPFRFSFNHPEGRCPHCEGRGAVLVEMHFLSDVWVTCEHCRGRRYDASTLAARWRGLTIADVLDLRVSEALEHFGAHRRISSRLRALEDVGLGYLRLGQAATTLSGGEAQRVKLANELHARGKGTVFVLDEPTTGLHFADTERLVAVLQRLVDGGATVIVIEHNPDVVKNADHVVDLGPEGGVGGGRLVASGTPEFVATQPTATGVVLARLLG